jgi:hypothetical protein
MTRLSDITAWAQTRPGLWRSLDGRYAIVGTVLPEDRPDPTPVYTLRKIDPASARAHPGTLGHFLAEEYSLGQAQQCAERDAYCQAHAEDMSVPDDFPCVALTRFWWPISAGTTRGALAVVRTGDQVFVQVIGMSRKTGAFEPAVYAETDVTRLRRP